MTIKTICVGYVGVVMLHSSFYTFVWLASSLSRSCLYILEKTWPLIVIVRLKEPTHINIPNS
jgi:hypothetical protein